MAYCTPSNLDEFLPLLQKNDTKFRQQVGADLLAYLAEPSNSIHCQDIGQLVDGLLPWMQSSNFKVSSNGIEIMTSLADRLGHDFRPYIQTVLPCVIDRLGDAKDTVREKSQLLILKLLERDVLSPQSLLDKLSSGFTHKNSKIREEVLRCLVNTLNEHGAHCVSLSKFIPHIVDLLSDPTASVRDTAFNTLVELYKHVGDKLRVDLERRNLVPHSKMPTLLARFEEVKNSGELLCTATTMTFDDVDRVANSKSATLMKKPAIPPMKRSNSNLKSGVSSSNNAGALDEEVFLKQFENVPTIQLFGPREINEHMKVVQDTISDPNKDWNKRAEALKKLRSLVIAGAAKYVEFHTNLKNMEYALQATIKDLRSQVVREACITIAFLSQSIGNKFDHAAEHLLNPLINLIQNSAKIMATSGLVCVRFIIQHTQHSRLIPIITTNLQSSKSKDIRRSCCEFMEFILSYWPTHLLEKHVALLQDTVKKGIADADPEARVLSRKAFRSFRDQFPEQSEVLLASLEPSYRKALLNELSLSSSSSSGSLIQSSKNSRQKTASNILQAPATTDGKKGFRSNSAIDLQAAQRARARAQYSAMARQKVASGTTTLPRPKKSPDTVMSPERLGRSRNRSSGISQSQPTSRSGSPSSRLPYYSRMQGSDTDSPRPRRLSSGIPRSITGSRDTSRETSPTRGNNLSRFRRNSDRPPLGPLTRPVMAQKILQQSREAESALADALSFDQSDYQTRISSPRKMRSLENHSDDSETSSICSERSYDSYKRPNDSYSWSGSQQRLSSREFREIHDINEIIALCASTIWQERKEGLLSLHFYLSNGSQLSPGELKHLTEIFTKTFMDPHTKGLSVFLDTINELIKRHKADLHDWLNVLMHRVFYKMGTDILMSAYNKLCGTLDNIRKSFPIPLQLSCLYKVLTDVAQKPTLKGKLALLEYLTSVYKIADADQFVTKAPFGKAFEKILIHSQDTKSSELREAARVCVIAMWNCNIPQVTLMLSELPRDLQEVARNIVQREMSRHCEVFSPSMSSSPKSLSSPVRDDIFKSLQKTTSEIQNYSYEPLLPADNNFAKFDVSGGGGGGGGDAKNSERLDSLESRAAFNRSAGDSYAVNGLNDSNGYANAENLNQEEVVANVLQYCMLDNPMSSSEKCASLEQLLLIIGAGAVEPVVKNFRKLLRIFIDILSQNELKSAVLVLKILGAIFDSDDLKECWSNFIELLTLRVLDAFCHDAKEVRTAAEATTNLMSKFPFNTVISTLSPLIQTTPYPKMNGAIKMITRFIEMHPEKVSDNHLDVLMPGLVKANDHDQSIARKSAVFCMVAIHKAVGEERMAPYLKQLSGAKLKLLKLYIDKDKSQQDGTTRNARQIKNNNQ